MLFNSLEFIALFFPLVTVLYFLLPHRFRWVQLLVASCYFYMAFVPKYILILVFLILFDYFAGLAIEQARGARRKAYLVASLAANVSVLAAFKYWNFLNGNVEALFHSLGLGYGLPYLAWVLPIGLSFHTFQSMSYTIEVYRGAQAAERNLGVYALYVMFYPQLVAGPIERPQNLLWQFRKPMSFDYDRFVDGLKLMTQGFFKKVFVADRLGIYTDQIYNNAHAHAGWSFPFIVSAYFFTFQIYCDFSGYSDIARGCARIMGFELMLNFDFPYSSKSIAEFWQRWHISLSTWFRDYVYIPLGGNRVSRARKFLNLVVVFLISGFWHGAGWSFGLWGVLHAFFIISGELLKPLRDAVCAALGLARGSWLRARLAQLTTFHLAAFAWIFFRANSLSDAGLVLTQIARAPLDLARSWAELVNNEDIQAGLLAVALLCAFEALYRSRLLEKKTAAPGRLGLSYAHAYYALLLLLLFMGAPLEERAFIYFQF